jgi:hypothetical protein
MKKNSTYKVLKVPGSLLRLSVTLSGQIGCSGALNLGFLALADHSVFGINRYFTNNKVTTHKSHRFIVLLGGKALLAAESVLILSVQ